MCGRFTAFFSLDDIARIYGADVSGWDFAADFNIAPGRDILTVRFSHEALSRTIEKSRWGFVPSWARSIKQRPINARSETAAVKPFFRQAIKSARCVIPANGYYEWKKEQDGTKTPFYIHRPEGLLSFAGLYSLNRLDESANPQDTVCILTRSAYEPLRDIHDRSPLVLTAESVDKWLDAGLTDGASLLEENLQTGSPKLIFHQVSTRVNNPAYNSEDSISITQ